MPAPLIRDVKASLIRFIDTHAKRLNLSNFQFPFATHGAAQNKVLEWYTRRAKLGEARFYSTAGTYPEYFSYCLNELFYSLQVADGSLLQLYVRPDNHGLVEGGSFAFLPRPNNGYDYFRVDFEPTQARHYRHNRYHVHFGFAATDMRVSMFQCPWPCQFLAFIAHLMSEGKKTSPSELDFCVDAQILGFDREKHFDSLDACGERYNHSFRLHLCAEGGTELDDLKAPGWIEDIGGR